MRGIDADAVRDMIVWALSRIGHCRREEAKFGDGIAARQCGPLPQALIEAWTERRALTAVLEQIGVEMPTE